MIPRNNTDEMKFLICECDITAFQVQELFRYRKLLPHTVLVQGLFHINYIHPNHKLGNLSHVGYHKLLTRWGHGCPGMHGDTLIGDYIPRVISSTDSVNYTLGRSVSTWSQVLWHFEFPLWQNPLYSAYAGKHIRRIWNYLMMFVPFFLIYKNSFQYY